MSREKTVVGYESGESLGSGITRREFIKDASLGALGAGLAISGLRYFRLAFAEEDPGKITMKYRRLGRTEIMVSEIGFGTAGMRDPAVLNAAIDHGVNYVDTAPGYGNSEDLIGQVMRRRRKDVYLATKWHWPADKKEEMITSLERSLKRLQTDYVDVIQVHQLENADGIARINNPELFEAFAKAKQEGKVRFLGCTSHAGSRSKILSHAIKGGKFDIILVSFNYSNYEQAGIEELLTLAKKHDVGVVGMKAQQGNAKVKGITDRKMSIRQANLKWVLSKDIATITSSMHTFDLMEEDTAASGKKFSMEDEKALQTYAAAITRDYCRGCDDCVPCPEGVAIPTVLRYSMYYKNYGDGERATSLYRELATNETAAACTSCGQCEDRCSFRLPIIKKLREAHSLMT